MPSFKVQPSPKSTVIVPLPSPFPFKVIVAQVGKNVVLETNSLGAVCSSNAFSTTLKLKSELVLIWAERCSFSTEKLEGVSFSDSLSSSEHDTIPKVIQQIAKNFNFISLVFEFLLVYE